IAALGKQVEGSRKTPAQADSSPEPPGLPVQRHLPPVGFHDGVCFPLAYPMNTGVEWKNVDDAGIYIRGDPALGKRVLESQGNLQRGHVEGGKVPVDVTLLRNLMERSRRVAAIK